MTEAPPAKGQRKHRFYDVQIILQHFEKGRVKTPSPILSRGFRMVLNRLDSVQGFVIVASWPVLLGGAMLLVVIGAMYGLLAFLAGTGGLLLALSFIVERKVGRSLQFGEYSLLRRGVAQALAFAAFLGLIFFMLFVSQAIT